MSKRWHEIFLFICTIAFLPYGVFAEEPLTMQQSIESALKNSAIVNIAKENSKAATAQKKEAMTAFLPRFSTTYSYTHLNEDPFIRIPSFSLFNGFWKTPSFDIPAGTANNYNWSIEAKQPLYTGGAITSTYQASKIGEDAARLEELAKQQDVVQQVKTAYFNILRAKKIQEAAKQSVEMLKAHRDIARNFFQVGMIPKNDFLQAEVVLANGNQALIKSTNMVDLAKSHFNTILKRDVSLPVDVVDILDYQPLKLTFEECVKIARQARPELKVASLRVAQAGKLVKVAQSEYFPSLGMVGNYTRYGDNPSVSGSDFKDQESWYVMAVASWNFWEWGKTKYRVEAGKAKENQALELNRELNDQIALEIKNAYLMLQEDESQIAVSKKLIEQASENFRISEDRYKVSVATSTDVLDALALLTKAKSEYANALGTFNINLARLEKAMGIIWSKEEENIKVVEENPSATAHVLPEQKNNPDVGTTVPAVAASSVAAPADTAPPVVETTVSAPAVIETPVVAPTVAVPAVVAPPAVAANPVSAEHEQNLKKTLPQNDIVHLIDKWLVSWQTGDMDAYRSCYAADFQVQGKDLDAWIFNKNKIREKSKNISIRMGDVQISSDAQASTARAVFTQYYSSSIHNDKVRKTLILKKVDGEWKIGGETYESL